MKQITFRIVAGAFALALLASCNSNSNKETKTDTTGVSKVTTVDTGSNMIPAKKNFETTIDGKQTDLYVLKNHNGMEAAFTNYGGRLVSLLVPDKSGKMTDIVDGFNSVEGYVKSTSPYYGATIGRYGNRIAKGQFTLDGKKYQLSVNNLSLIHISEPTRQAEISYAVFC